MGEGSWVTRNRGHTFIPQGVFGTFPNTSKCELPIFSDYVRSSGDPKGPEGQEKKKVGNSRFRKTKSSFDPSESYASWEKTEVWQTKKGESRGQMSTPCKRVVSTYTRLSRGRPPLFGVAMSPKALKERKCVLKHKRKISQIRTAAKNSTQESNK